jgi:hypothetical protein
MQLTENMRHYSVPEGHDSTTRYFSDIFTRYVYNEAELVTLQAENTDKHIRHQLGVEKVRKTPKDKQREAEEREANKRKRGIKEGEEEKKDRSKQPRRGVDDKLVVSVNLKKNFNYLWLVNFHFEPIHSRRRTIPWVNTSEEAAGPGWTHTLSYLFSK